jgi:hypothetical protein
MILGFAHLTDEHRVLYTFARCYVGKHEEVVLMIQVIRSAWKLVVVGVALFLLLAGIGLFIALDAASSHIMAEADMADGLAGEQTTLGAYLPRLPSASVTSELGEEGSDNSRDTLPELGAFAENSDAAPTSRGLASGSTDGDTGRSIGGNNRHGSTNTNAPPATAPSNPSANKTWHEAFDEWVSEGHYEEHYVEAVYGQRNVFGSVCNSCGADISGFAASHLRDTHHSGYHEGVVGSESYIIKPAISEQVWVDTSHYVHHEGYWS